MITLNNLTLAYGTKTILEAAHTTFSRGTLTALVGRNGSGKSTLLRVLAAIDAPLSGSVLIDGKPLHSLAAVERAKVISFVSTQRVRVANMRCQDVVATGRAPYTNWLGAMQTEDSDIVRSALAAVGMSEFALRAIDTLSDGECQRVMIARALAQQTPVILLDEPTAFLDMPNRYELCTLLRRLAHEEQKCILFSTHELDIALSLCDAIALIAPPELHILPTDDMVRSGHIERLFTTGIVAFDPASRTVSVKSK